MKIDKSKINKNHAERFVSSKDELKKNNAKNDRSVDEREITLLKEKTKILTRGVENV